MVGGSGEIDVDAVEVEEPGLGTNLEVEFAPPVAASAERVRPSTLGLE